MHRTAAVLAAGLALAVLPGTAAGASPGAQPDHHHPASHRIVVAADGRGDFNTVQAAVDSVPSGNTVPTTILIRRGVYRGLVTIPADKPNLTLLGATGDPRDVVLTFDNASGTLKPDGTPYGTSGSATVLISANDTTARDITFENSFDEAAHPEISNRQAVALRTTGDRLVFEHDRFLGNQDTLYVNSPSTTVGSRQYYLHCEIVGDVDFIFGRGTAVFDRTLIRALSRGSTDNNGYITAAATPIANSYGFLITRSRIVSDAPAQTFHLGRPWHPGGDVTAIAQVLIRDSWLPAAIKATPWTDFSGFSWKDARLAEYRNAGPGATVTADRPQLDRTAAADFTARRYLAGTDGWNPVRADRDPHRQHR
ncbi:MAG TPA: pectinesterase family protein [Mycobacteriales bacterium]|nr:pectinesterase family protein [Mycobacteriales bacterium]